MDQEVIQLLKKYVQNTCSPQELEEVERIIASGSFENEWKQVLEAEAVIDMASNGVADEPEFNSEAVFRKINNTIHPKRRLTLRPWISAIAAAVLLTLSIGYLFLNRSPAPAGKIAFLHLVNPAGKQKKVTLEDGTQVTLNCGSTLSYAAHFAADKREVFLEGEAFFDVKHDDKKPFLVHTSRVKVQVLGTSFNVRSYAKDARAAVSVATGKVGVNGNKAATTYMLLPGDLLSYSRNNEVRSAKVSTEDIMAWQKGILVFHLETIREIVPVLERYYGVDITVHQHFSQHKQVTASFNNKTLPEVLEILAQTSGFSYTIDKNQVHIH